MEGKLRQTENRVGQSYTSAKDRQGKEEEQRGGCTTEFGGMMVTIVTVVTRKWNALHAQHVWYIY
jgi:hypothetical protein